MEWWLSLYVWNAEGACPQWHITERGGETLNMLSLRKAGDSVSVRGVCGEWGGGGGVGHVLSGVELDFRKSENKIM